MQSQNNIIDCYNKTAENYAVQFIDELSHKHFDSLLLKAFAAENTLKGKLIDLGCGPGQTTKYLADCGFTDLVGTDLSEEMIRVAKPIHPQLTFEVADMLSLSYPDNYFGSAVAFYSIVHFDYEQVKEAFTEIKRVLITGGAFLFSFHIGDQVVHLDNFLEHPVNIDFHFFDTAVIKNLLAETGFEIVDVIERYPYPDVEHQSKRAYIWVKNT